MVAILAEKRRLCPPRKGQRPCWALGVGKGKPAAWSKQGSSQETRDERPQLWREEAVFMWSYHGLSKKEKRLRGPAPTSQLERDRAQGVMDEQ